MTQEEARAILIASSDDVLARIDLSKAKVAARLFLATEALRKEDVSFALIGGLAVAAWVRTADQGGDRGSPHVDLLVPRLDAERASLAIQGTGLFYKGHGTTFGETPRLAQLGKIRIWHLRVPPDRGMHFRPKYLERAVVLEGIPTIGLVDLVEHKLELGRRVDLVHIRDLIGVGLVDASWFSSLPAGLDSRLQQLLDDPEG